MTNVTIKTDDATDNDVTADSTVLKDVLNSEISLEEKLAAIELAMKNAQAQANEEAVKNGTVAAPVDPADLTMCDSCQ